MDFRVSENGFAALGMRSKQTKRDHRHDYFRLRVLEHPLDLAFAKCLAVCLGSLEVRGHSRLLLVRSPRRAEKSFINYDRNLLSPSSDRAHFCLQLWQEALWPRAAPVWSAVLCGICQRC